MAGWDAVRWPLETTTIPTDVRDALLVHARDDARELGVDADAYRAWLTDALGGAPASGAARAAVADGALEGRPFSEQVNALLRVSAARRDRVDSRPSLDVLISWCDAELSIVGYVAQARIDDPASARNRLATLGKAAGTLGHELRNPLGVIQSSVYLLGRRGSDDEKAKRHIEKIGKHAGVCHRIIEDLMHLARNVPPRLESVDVAEAFGLAVEEAALPVGVTCRVEAPAGQRVQADPGLLQRALVNLLRNANTAMRGSGIVRLGRLETPNEQVLQVRDEGPGFPPDLLDQAFDPLSTTSGIGLGLALVESVMRRHGGRATASNMPEGGACVALYFPRAGTSPPP